MPKLQRQNMSTVLSNPNTVSRTSTHHCSIYSTEGLEVGRHTAVSDDTWSAVKWTDGFHFSTCMATQCINWTCRGDHSAGEGLMSLILLAAPTGMWGNVRIHLRGPGCRRTLLRDNRLLHISVWRQYAEAKTSFGTVLVTRPEVIKDRQWAIYFNNQKIIAYHL